MQDLICNVCGGNEWKSVYTKRMMHPLWWLSDDSIDTDLNYVICQRCGYITLFPRLSYTEYETYYRLAPTPSREAFSERTRMYELRKAFIFEHMDKQEFDVVIEVGSAYGDFLVLLSEFKKRVGIEPSPTYCEFVKASKLPLEYHCCMLEQVPEYAPKLLSSANLAVGANVLEHAFEPRTFVRHLFSLVKPGGYVYIEVPSVEAMAEVKDLAYQTLHFGHISQFSTDVLNQLCISESLESVSVEVSVKDEYPVIRGLYRRPDRAGSIARLFRRHAQFVDVQAERAKTILVEYLVSKKFRQMVLWGCGEDLLDVLRLLDDSQLALLSTQAKLVDMNSSKQHRKLAGIEIQDPTSLPSHQIDAVLISSRSKLIQSDIIKNAKRIFPDAQYISLY